MASPDEGTVSMTRRRRQEDTDIDQYLYPALDVVGISRANIRRNVATSASGLQRGDLWIADVPHTDPQFDRRILTLIECKDRGANLDDSDWLDGKAQGQEKARRQHLHSFFVTNTFSVTRCYNTADVTEITIDGQLLTHVPPMPVLRSIQTQVREGISNVTYRSFARGTPNPNRFRSSLWNLRQIFRSAGVSRGSEDKIIKTTLTFCILKIISEQQRMSRTIPETVYLWDDWRVGQIARDIRNCIADLTQLHAFSHLADCLDIHSRLNADHCRRIYDELGQYTLFDSDFDFFGMIYESMANKDLKKDFGEFYTPRHVIQFMVSTLLRNERSPRRLQIYDPACGSGGFLVEAFLFLRKQYEEAGHLDPATLAALKEHTFFGFDTNDEVAIPYARTNMMMAGDSGANILKTDDSLMDTSGSQYDYILANIPYGVYAGHADGSLFSYANSKRYEILFLEKVVSFLRDGGSAAIIVPDSIVEATSYWPVRQKFLFDVRLDAVVSLPPFVFEPYTSEKNLRSLLHQEDAAGERTASRHAHLALYYRL